MTLSTAAEEACGSSLTISESIAIVNVPPGLMEEVTEVAVVVAVGPALNAPE
jgi:hypothetical protein